MILKTILSIVIMVPLLLIVNMSVLESRSLRATKTFERMHTHTNEILEWRERIAEAEAEEAIAIAAAIEAQNNAPVLIPNAPGFIPHDIPLSIELQQYTWNLCQERGLDFEIVLALMFAESTYRPWLIHSNTNGSRDYGIMQINTVNHARLRDELGLTDFLCPFQNINAGTHMLSDLYRRFNDVHKMLMAYNFGEWGARAHWDNGTFSSRYSRKIVDKAEQLRMSIR